MIREYLLLSGMLMVSAVAGAASLIMYRTLDSSGKTAMTKMKLHSEKTFKEFKALKYVHILQAAALLTMGVGVVAGFNFTVHIARTATVIQGTVTAAVIFRWWRRFQ